MLPAGAGPNYRTTAGACCTAAAPAASRAPLQSQAWRRHVPPPSEPRDVDHSGDDAWFVKARRAGELHDRKQIVHWLCNKVATRAHCESRSHLSKVMHHPMDEANKSTSQFDPVTRVAWLARLLEVAESQEAMESKIRRLRWLRGQMRDQGYSFD